MTVEQFEFCMAIEMYKKLAADFPLTLPNDGEYGLTVRVWRHDLPGQDTTHDPDAVLRARVVVDSSPAKIVVRGNAGIVLKSKTEPLPASRRYTCTIP